MSTHIVKTEVFEGPLDLLLELIEKRKLLINDISLASVTDEYIKRVQSMDEIPLSESADFVALAATLLLIKSRSLLPALVLTEEESRDIRELQYRLALYQILKEAAKDLQRAAENPPLWEGSAPEPEPLFVPDERATVPQLHAMMRRLLDEFPKLAELPKVAVKKAISLEEMIDRLAGRISSAVRLSFKEFSGHGKGHTEKYDIVVSFLALLELMKQGIIRATQDRHFSDIMLESDTISTPSYE